MEDESTTSTRFNMSSLSSLSLIRVTYQGKLGLFTKKIRFFSLAATRTAVISSLTPSSPHAITAKSSTKMQYSF